MVELFTGTPGSGKSLHTASILFYKLHQGYPCLCNFNINFDKLDRWYHKVDRKKFFYVDNSCITPKYLINFAKNFWNGKRVKEDSIYLVIDECQLMFNSRDWQKSGRAEWLSFFTQHRKLGYHIILICQFDRMIDRQIRAIVEYQVIHRKVSNIGLMGQIFSLFALGNLFIMIKYYYPLNEKIEQEFFKAKKKFYSLYDTYSTF